MTLVWMPLTGLLMVINSNAWPLSGLLAGAIYLDAAGREAAKVMSFKHEGVRIGAPKQQRLFFSTYFIMAALGVFMIVYSAAKIWNEF